MAGRLETLVSERAGPRTRNLLGAIVNQRNHRRRRGGAYQSHRDYHQALYTATADQLDAMQRARLQVFIEAARRDSPFFARRFDGLAPIDHVDKLRQVDILTKADLVRDFDSICTLKPGENGSESFTGGTTGASLRVMFRVVDQQERFAILDLYREQFGYVIGQDRLTHFGGRVFAAGNQPGDAVPEIRDPIQRTQFFSTYHIGPQSIHQLLDQMGTFGPSYLSGYPSSVVDIVTYARAAGLEKQLAHAGRNLQVMFSTAEPATPEVCTTIQDGLGARVVDQYASSEGAPFILECVEGNLHLDPLSGVFEVVDDDLQPTDNGTLLLTSFTTSGTPLIRYQIGDDLHLDSIERSCSCGQQTRLVRGLMGRSGDYLVTSDGRRVSFVSLSTASKGVRGLLTLQVAQTDDTRYLVRVEAAADFTTTEQQTLLENLKLRLGDTATLRLEVVDRVTRSARGKAVIFRDERRTTTS